MNNITNIIDMYRYDFRSYIGFSYRTLHPYEHLQDNWHIDLLAGHIEALVKNGEKRLIINLPPRTLKSHCVSVALTTWLLGRDPSTKILCLHGSDVLGRDLHDASRQLMMHPRYRALFPGTVIHDNNRKIQTTFGGKRLFLPFMKNLTGLGADYIIIDDPISATDAQNDSMRDAVNRQFDRNIIQRLNHKSSGIIIVVMQRLHEHDLTGHLLSKKIGFHHLNIPAIAMEDTIWKLPHNKTYQWRKGEALHKTREPREELIKTLHLIGGYAFAHQYLQGLYKPHFGENEKGAIWLSPAREGEFYDFRTNTNPHGFYHISEEHLITAKVFGIGEDPYPDNMRYKLTLEEVLEQARLHREKHLEEERLRIEAENKESG